jgi:hypothetical protein
MAYEYGTAIGRSASQTLELPVNEILGYAAFRRVKAENQNG